MNGQLAALVEIQHSRAALLDLAERGVSVDLLRRLVAHGSGTLVPDREAELVWVLACSPASDTTAVLGGNKAIVHAFLVRGNEPRGADVALAWLDSELVWEWTRGLPDTGVFHGHEVSSGGRP
jgi:hypothetical protein